MHIPFENHTHIDASQFDDVLAYIGAPTMLVLALAKQYSGQQIYNDLLFQNIYQNVDEFIEKLQDDSDTSRTKLPHNVYEKQRIDFVAATAINVFMDTGLLNKTSVDWIRDKVDIIADDSSLKFTPDFYDKAIAWSHQNMQKI